MMTTTQELNKIDLYNYDLWRLRLATLKQQKAANAITLVEYWDKVTDTPVTVWDKLYNIH